MVKTNNLLIKWIIRGVIILIIAIVILLIIIYKENVNVFLTNFITWVRNNPVAGPFVLAVVYIVCTILFIPGSILTLGAGLAFN